MLLVLGWRSLAEDALWRLDTGHVTVIQPGRTADVPAERRHQTTVVSAPIDNIEQILAGLGRVGVKLADITGVATAHEFALVTASVLAQALGVPGPGAPEVVLRFRDKHLQKEAVRAGGVRTARTTLVHSVADLGPEVGAELGYPIVVKPLAAANSQDTEVLHDAAEIERYREHSTGQAGSARLVEEYIRGQEYHADGVVREGRLGFLSICRYFTPVIEMPDGLVGGTLLHPRIDAVIYQRLCPLVEAALLALELRDGVFHLEAFDTPGGFAFGECAVRPGGGFISPVVRHAFGVDLYEEQMRIVLGLPPTDARSPPDSRVCHVALQTPDGTVATVPTTEDVLARPGVVHAVITCRPGDQVRFLRQALNGIAGWAVVEIDRSADIDEYLAKLVGWFAARTEMIGETDATSRVPNALPG